jgi:hypothetical protein
MLFPVYWRFLLKGAPKGEGEAEPSPAQSSVPATDQSGTTPLSPEVGAEDRPQASGLKTRPYDEKDIVVLGPWYRVDSRKAERRSRTVGLAPFFAYTRAGENDRYLEFLGGLFARDVQDGRRRFRLFYVFHTRAKELR